MNKYRIKTIEENGQYIGVVLNNDEVVYTSSPQATSTLASIQVTKYINEIANKPLTPPVAPTANISALATESVHASPASVPEPAPRRCCGRG